MILVIVGLAGAMLWLVLLEASSFNIVTISLGLLVMLAITPAATGAR